MNDLTDQQRLEELRPLSKWHLPACEIDEKTCAYRAQYDALVEKIESQTPRHC